MRSIINSLGYSLNFYSNFAVSENEWGGIIRHRSGKYLLSLYLNISHLKIKHFTLLIIVKKLFNVDPKHSGMKVEAEGTSIQKFICKMSLLS